MLLLFWCDLSFFWGVGVKDIWVAKSDKYTLSYQFIRKIYIFSALIGHFIRSTYCRVKQRVSPSTKSFSEG